MSERVTYRAPKGVLYRVIRSYMGFGIYFHLPKPGNWIRCAGFGYYPTARAAEERLADLAREMRWEPIGSAVPNPVAHWAVSAQMKGESLHE